MRLYIIRHADPDYANNTITPAGHAEGRALAAYLQTLGVDEIYSSPLGRAIDTARYTADLLNQPIRIEPWLQELGELWIEDLQMVFWNYDSYLFRSNEILADLNHWRNYPPLDNQRVSQNLERVGRESDVFVERQGFVRQGGCYSVREANRKKIAVFTHLGLTLTWLSHLLEIPLPLMWSGFYLHPSSVTTVLFDERPQGIAVPRCLRVGDISHLHKAGLPPQPAGIVANYY